MVKRRYYISIVAFLIIVCVSCSSNKSLQKQEDTNGNTNNPPQTEQSKVPEQKTKSKEIGNYQTNLVDKDRNRVRNITLAARKINGYVVKPGEVFSFNKVVGERTTSKGYRKAKIFLKGETDEDIGGGVCQLSSTIYNAAEKSGLEILERHSHSKEVAYVPLGKDAAVNYGSLDFKFKNNKNYPVRIKASVKNGKVFVWILRV